MSQITKRTKPKVAPRKSLEEIRNYIDTHITDRLINNYIDSDNFLEWFDRELYREATDNYENEKEFYDIVLNDSNCNSEWYVSIIEEKKKCECEFYVEYEILCEETPLEDFDQSTLVKLIIDYAIPHGYSFNEVWNYYLENSGWKAVRASKQ